MDMNYPDSRSSFMQPPYGAWNQYPVNNPLNHDLFDPHSQSDQQSQQSQQQQPPFKRARHSEDNQPSPSPYPPMNSNSRMPPINPPVNKGISNIFYKTRMCAKFRAGACRNGENCNFAHGIEDLRQPPPNWQELVGVTNEERERSSLSVGNNNSDNNWDEDQKIIQRMKLCRKFCFGEECPYGERCNFLHEDPVKFREDSGRYMESSVINIGTNTGPPMGNASGSNNQLEVNRSAPVNNALMKPVYWKTKLCAKFEMTGHCQFGDKCHFAHGQAELQIMGGRPEEEAVNVPIFSTTKPQVLPVNDASAVKTATVTAVPYVNEEGQGKKCLFKWREPKKLNRIYADWIDDLPLAQKLEDQVES